MRYVLAIILLLGGVYSGNAQARELFFGENQGRDIITERQERNMKFDEQIAELKKIATGQDEMLAAIKNLETSMQMQVQLLKAQQEATQKNMVNLITAMQVLFQEQNKIIERQAR